MVDHVETHRGRGVARRRLAPAFAVTFGVLGGAAAALAGAGLHGEVSDARARADAVEIVQLRSQLRRVSSMP